MSSSVWPVLPGVIQEEPEQLERAVTVHTMASGKEYRTSWGTAPRYRFTLRGTVRKNVVAPAPWAASSEAAIVRKFYDDHGGSFDSFLFDDDFTGTQYRVRFDGPPRLRRSASSNDWYEAEIVLVSVIAW
jgi:hypothetical protein